ncbi:MAG: tol-pal system protein YbgF [Rhizobiales bacterium]|nr:tol-pal system protein YbgF [Hyphomicrobiales bacterium]
MASFVLIMAGAGQALAQSASDVAVRMDQVEERMRQLMGQVEQLTFEVKQLKAQLGKTDTGAADPALPPQLNPRKLAADQRPAAATGSQDAAIMQAPVQTPAKARDQAAAAAPLSQGVEQIGDQPADNQTYVKTEIGPDGSEQQVIMRKAPGPKVLGSLAGSNAAGSQGDGGFQGQVLVAPAQQEAGADAVIVQGGTGQPAGPDDQNSIQTVSLAPDSPEALYERSNEALLRRQFGDAEAGFRTFLQKYPDHSLAGSAQYWLGETYYAQGDFRQAAQAFLQGYRQFPDSRRAADSLLKLGISLGKLGQTQQACTAFDSVSSQYPKAVEARKRAQAEARRANCQS